MRDSNLYAILPASRLGKIRTFAPPFSVLKGYVLSMISGNHRGVGLHLAIHHQVGRPLPDQLDGAPHLVGERMAGAAEIRERQHRYARLHVEAPRLSAAMIAISARSSAVGSIFTVASARK